MDEPVRQGVGGRGAAPGPHSSLGAGGTVHQQVSKPKSSPVSGACPPGTRRDGQAAHLYKGTVTSGVGSGAPGLGATGALTACAHVPGTQEGHPHAAPIPPPVLSCHLSRPASTRDREGWSSPQADIGEQNSGLQGAAGWRALSAATPILAPRTVPLFSAVVGLSLTPQHVREKLSPPATDPPVPSWVSWISPPVPPPLTPQGLFHSWGLGGVSITG